MSEPFIGQIQLFGFNFAPRNWSFCEGQLLSIAQNTALFSLLGTTFGGDGRVTFGLPDLRGRVPLGPGTGPGLSNYTWGEKSGTETNTLTVAQLPAHNHSVAADQGATAVLQAQNTPGNQANPEGNRLAQSANSYIPGSRTDVVMMNNAILTGNTANAGGGQPVNNMQPFLAVYYSIALMGIFPSRN